MRERGNSFSKSVRDNNITAPYERNQTANAKNRKSSGKGKQYSQSNLPQDNQSSNGMSHGNQSAGAIKDAGKKTKSGS